MAAGDIDTRIDECGGLSGAAERHLIGVFKALNYRGEEAARQLRHRLAVARAWGLREGDRVLEIGCGQGDMTVALAALVGGTGSVLALDSADGEAGSPVTLREGHDYIRRLPIGGRIEFRVSTDLLDPATRVPPDPFDWVVFSHSIWYLESGEILRALLRRVRPLARRLGVAEWHTGAVHIEQLPHLLAAVLQMHVQSLTILTSGRPQASGNIRNLLGVREVQRIVEEAGWRTVSEEILETSLPLRFGKVSEIVKAISMAGDLSQTANILPAIRGGVASMAETLHRVHDTGAQSLATFSLVAE